MKPVTGLTVWGAATSGTTTELDNNFAALQTAVNDLNTYANFLTDTGAASDYVVTLAGGLTGPLTNGLLIQMKAANTNDGGSTLNYNGTGVKAIYNQNGTNLDPRQIIAGGIYSLQYSSALTAWLLQTPYQSGWRLILQQAANANANVYFNNSLSGIFDQYRLEITDLRAETDAVTIAVQVGNSNAPTYQNTDYDWSGIITGPNGNANSSFIGSTSNTVVGAIPLTGPVQTMGNATSEVLSSEISIMGPGIGNYTVISHQTCYSTTDGTSRRTSIGGYWGHNSPVTSLRIFANSGNIASGNFALYGLVKI